MSEESFAERLREVADNYYKPTRPDKVVKAIKQFAEAFACDGKYECIVKAKHTHLTAPVEGGSRRARPFLYSEEMFSRVIDTLRGEGLTVDVIELTVERAKILVKW